MEEIKPLQNSQKNKQPSNLEAEQALLGSILVNNDIIDEISTFLSKTSIFFLGGELSYDATGLYRPKNY